MFENETCDCFHQGNDPEEYANNRYYVREDINFRCCVTFLQWLGYSLPHGHTHTVAHPLKCAPGKCAKPFDWRLQIDSTLMPWLLPMEPTHVFINLGFWPFRNRNNEAFWKRVHSSSLKLSQLGTQFFWATTTPLRKDVAVLLRKKENLCNDMPKVLNEVGWKLFDRCAIVMEMIRKVNGRTLFRDAVHFKSAVYNNFSQQLLASIPFEHKGLKPNKRKAPPKVEDFIEA
eukprot:GGOE01056650.1.p1 GENE.GGOE01056650.1~~GGOE01056650.1.p1  ORF type:complete len:264 (-),score=47.26 GGOE01056650.1:84-773(-)